MNTLKSHILSQENKNRRNFILLILALILVEYLYQGNDLVRKWIETNEFLGHFFQALIFLFTGFVLIALGRFIVLRFYLNRKIESAVQPNFVLGINRISVLLNVFVILITLMLAFGIKPLEFLTSITIVAAAIAILTKDYITGIINGLIIMFSDQIAVGDKIKIGNHLGFVQDITLINLVIKDNSNNLVIIPNIQALNLDVVNYSKGKTYQIVFTSELDIKEEEAISKIPEKITGILEKYGSQVEIEGFVFSVLERKKDSFLVRVQFPLLSAYQELETAITQEINQALIYWNDEKGKA